MDTVFTSDDPIITVEFVHNDWSCDTLAIVTSQHVMMCQVLMEPEVTCTEMKRYSLPTTPLSFTLSPDTCAESQMVRFAVCDMNKTLRVTEGMTSSIITEGKFFLNDAAFNPDQLSEIAVVGDDSLCRFFVTDGSESRAPLLLSSPGRRVGWIRGGSVVIGEESGRVRIVRDGRTVKVIEGGREGMIDVDWTFDWTAILMPGQLLLADLSNNRTTKIALPTQSDNPGSAPVSCRWCPSNPGLLAITCVAAPPAVLQQKMGTFLSCMESASGCRAVSWHQHRSLIAMARHYEVILWSVDTV